MIGHDTDFDELWESAPEPRAPLTEAELGELPEPARRYLRHAIADGAPLASVVRLQMHGTFKMQGQWSPFEAEQVLRVHRGFVWRASIRMKGIPVRGSDRWVDGEGAVKWKLLGIIPVANESGPAISRSAVGRAQIEGVLLPPALVAEAVGWEAVDADHTAARVRLGDEVSRVELGLGPAGELRDAVMLRWGTPDGIGTEPKQERFGCLVEAERTFGDYTIPSQFRVGWYIGTDRWDEGEFFRATIDEAEFR